MSKISFLEAFNAKDLRLGEMVGSFVPSEEFWEIAGNWNALVVGPRGSGKTTYLRMLAIEAMRGWNHERAASLRAAVGYTGIYVPADIAWGAMVESLGGGRLDEECFQAVTTAAFCTNVLQATAATISAAASAPDGYGALNFDQATIESLVVDIANAWRLDLQIPSLNALETALMFRMLDIHAGSLELAAKKDVAVVDVYARLPFATLPFDVAITAALSFVDRVAERPDHKWALLLDEFEIAHPSLQRLVLGSLRSANKKLLYKVALAPCGPHTAEALDTLAPPSHKNDYRQINLWHSDKLSALRFCEQLFYSRLGSQAQLKGRTPTQVFGSTWDGDADENSRSEKVAEKNERLRHDFGELNAKDRSFASFIEKKGINPLSPDTSQSVVRKVAPIVAFRNAHRGLIGARKGRKKLLDFYTGWEALAAISEGNPRWFIGMLNMVVSRHGDSLQLPIDRSIQYGAVQEASEAFSAMLQTAATEHAMGITTSKSVFELLSTIGAYFNRRLVDEEFIEEIPLSFEVAGVDLETEKALRIAINLGAVVSLSEPDDVGGFRVLQGKRFRLAYLLAPEFKLPLRSTKSVSLSSVLAPPLPQPSRNKSEHLDLRGIGNQGTLF
ncbi:ORC-CDC6 family AAA ATPase [Paraburkholderia sediminicola]|uniref:ORC-CDC6 family AAA ATPase n=1 Tax=Paraburkholderia sediminicola TaxID=458836 RepID=UPI0038BDC126